MSAADKKAALRQTDQLQGVINDVVRLMRELTERHQELLTVIEMKADAMKRADRATLADCQEKQKALLARIDERCGFRRQLMDKLGALINLPSRTARAMTVSQVCSRLPKGSGNELRKSADELKQVLLAVSKANNLARSIAEPLCEHLGVVLTSITAPDSEQADYAADGAKKTPSEAVIFEAVG